ILEERERDALEHFLVEIDDIDEREAIFLKCRIVHDGKRCGYRRVGKINDEERHFVALERAACFSNDFRACRAFGVDRFDRECVAAVSRHFLRKRFGVGTGCDQYPLQFRPRRQAWKKHDTPQRDENRGDDEIEEEDGLGRDTESRNEKEKERRDDDVDDLRVEKRREETRAKKTRVLAVETREKKYEDPYRKEKGKGREEGLDEIDGRHLEVADRERDQQRNKKHDDITRQKYGVFALRNEVHIW